MKDSISSFEWHITDICNYNCPYCNQNHNKKHCSGQIIDKVIDFLPKLEGEWLIKLIGGEPSMHPRFFEICKRIVSSGHEDISRSRMIRTNADKDQRSRGGLI